MMTTVYPCDTGVITNTVEEIKLGFSISFHKIKKKGEGEIFRTKALNNNKSNLLEKYFSTFLGTENVFPHWYVLHMHSVKGINWSEAKC